MATEVRWRGLFGMLVALAGASCMCAGGQASVGDPSGGGAGDGGVQDSDGGGGLGSGGGGNNGGGGGGGAGVGGPVALNKCPAGQQTTLTGIVTAPNGIAPIPRAYVYVPSSIHELPPQVDCKCNDIPATALVWTKTNTDGTFTLGPVPTLQNQAPGTTVKVVAQKGRFRKVIDVPIANPCGPNALAEADLQMPKRRDRPPDAIPRMAVVQGEFDTMECVLNKIGIEPGQFDLYSGDSLTGASANLPRVRALLSDAARLATYDIVFVNCSGGEWQQVLTDPAIRANVERYVGLGGRLYVTDLSYDFVEQIEQWSPVIDFGPDPSGPEPEPWGAAERGTADITTEALVTDSFLAEWMKAVEPRAKAELISDQNRVHVEHFLSQWAMQHSIISDPTPDTKSHLWVRGPVTGDGLSGDLPLTSTFDYKQCGRVIYSSYHTIGGTSAFGGLFPAYCDNGKLSPQERILEYFIFYASDFVCGNKNPDGGFDDEGGAGKRDAGSVIN